MFPLYKIEMNYSEDNDDDVLLCPKKFCSKMFDSTQLLKHHMKNDHRKKKKSVGRKIVQASEKINNSRIVEVKGKKEKAATGPVSKVGRVARSMALEKIIRQENKTEESDSGYNPGPRIQSVFSVKAPINGTFTEPIRRSMNETVEPDSAFNCVKCTKSFASIYGLKRHYSTNLHKMNSSGPSSHKSTSEPKTPQRTRTSKSSEKQNILDNYCNKCSKSFSSPKSLKRHYKTDTHKNASPTGRQMVKRPVSPSAFDDASPPKEMIKCQLCKKVFSHLKDLREHLTIHARRELLREKYNAKKEMCTCKPCDFCKMRKRRRF